MYGFSDVVNLLCGGKEPKLHRWQNREKKTLGETRLSRGGGQFLSGQTNQ